MAITITRTARGVKIRANGVHAQRMFDALAGAATDPAGAKPPVKPPKPVPNRSNSQAGATGAGVAASANNGPRSKTP